MRRRRSRRRREIASEELAAAARAEFLRSDTPARPSQSTIDGGLLSRSFARRLVRSINFAFPEVKLPPGSSSSSDGGSRREFSREKRDREHPREPAFVDRPRERERESTRPPVLPLHSRSRGLTPRVSVAAATRRLRPASLPARYNNA